MPAAATPSRQTSKPTAIRSQGGAPPARAAARPTATPKAVQSGVKFCLPAPRVRLAGLRLQHCVDFIEAVLAKGLVVFKIGVTLDPQRRWHDPQMGYARDPDFHTMVVLLQVDSGEAVGYVEAGLLLKYLGRAGCRNVRPGGEGVSNQTPGPYFAYLVYRVLPDPPHRDLSRGVTELRSVNPELALA